ncbi:hypothetical protein tloyanaT_13210 [Thalassotalea loyana]|uniref:Uncharacterized protein n=1 Tax=Thalassotalea loyana TaxID=280483 RepID=A0ABQ6HCB3_9GAMM|nr:hypothetical protein [Thalassotalea loyana]GLX85069.1 hypothetical protein tloyanaT_13210 [Thalassotalea loyana]
MGNLNKAEWKRLSKQLMSLKPELRDIEADQWLVAFAQKAMSEKLTDARMKGRGGWWTTDCDTEFLKELLKEHVDKGDMRDVMNIAAMIWFRQAASIESLSE